MRYIISFTLASLLSCPASAEVPRVMTDIPPVGSLVAQVMGDLGTPTVLLDKGASAHAFQLRPSQAADLAAAQLVVWVGPEMTPWLDRALSGLGGSAAEVRLLTAPGTRLQEFGTEPAATAADDPAGHSHSVDDHAAEDHAAEDHAGHDHAGTDPHAWLDVSNAMAWLDEIARQLSALDPDNAVTYTANAAKTRQDLVQLDTDLAAQLAPVHGIPLVVFHDAYGYFATRYDLTVLGAISEGDAATPGAAHLRDLKGRMAGTAACLFPETNHDPDLVQTVADGTGARIGAALDPEGASLPNGPTLYGDMLRALAGAITDCAG
jgi:zinc transport system substrate-binding protein